MVLKKNLILTFAVIAGCGNFPSNLQLEMPDTKPTQNIVAFYEEFNTGGNTSVAFDNTDSYKWSGESPFRHESWGYFDTAGTEIPYIKRDRDLGQTFSINSEKSVELKAITVRTGFGDNVVRPGMFGMPLALQLFEVAGKPVLNTNGSTDSTNAFHGFPHNRNGELIDPIRDDYFIGEEFKSMAVFSGVNFPDKTAFGIAAADTSGPDSQVFKGRYLRFVLSENSKIMLEPGKTYAFIIMIEKPDHEVGFTLANNYMGNYNGGHGIRHDGNGIFPPVPANPEKDFTHPDNSAALQSAHFPTDFAARCRITPGTDGYPDVCTWRDLVFYIEAW